MTTNNVNILTVINNRQGQHKISDPFTTWMDDLETKKKDVIQEFSEDVLAISCCIQRLANGDAGGRFSRSLTSIHVASQVTDLDRQKAQNIRKYYGEKMTVLILQGRELTKFRKDLQQFLVMDALKVPESMCGMIYKLPDFYDYDMGIDEIFKSMYFKNSKVSNMNDYANRKLKFIKKIGNQRKHSSVMEYWFNDESLNKVMFKIDTNNPLITLLDRHIIDGKLDILGKYHLRKKDLNEYFVMEKWAFE